ncbi:hypothetical protein RN02_23740 [Pseudomonas sp. PI1]|nr:hypothetical protein RN02_23740 [Pseudomonas sp. PI1]
MAGIKRCAKRSTGGRNERGGSEERSRSGRQVEAMPANQAEVVGEHVAIQLVAELGAERTAADTACQAAKNGAGQRAEGNAQRAGNGADCCAGLTTSKSGGSATRCATDRADQGADLHGGMQRCDFGGVTARTLQ